MRCAGAAAGAQVRAALARVWRRRQRREAGRALRGNLLAALQVLVQRSRESRQCLAVCVGRRSAEDVVCLYWKGTGRISGNRVNGLQVRLMPLSYMVVVHPASLAQILTPACMTMTILRLSAGLKAHACRRPGCRGCGHSRACCGCRGSCAAGAADAAAGGAAHAAAAVAHARRRRQQPLGLPCGPTVSPGNV